MFLFNNFLTVDEILLLEKIKNKLFVYDYNRPAQYKIGNQTYTPVVPNISYMANNIYELYQLFLKLQSIIFSNKYFRDSSTFIDLVQHQYYSKNYALCKKQINKNIIKYKDFKLILNCYDFLCDYFLNNKDVAFKKIEKLFKDQLDIVSFRDMLIPIIKEEKVQDFLKQYYTEEKLKYFNDVIKNEENQKNCYITQAESLKKYYRDKADSTQNKEIVN